MGSSSANANGEPDRCPPRSASELLTGVIPKPVLAETTAAVQAAIPAMWRTGIVAIHNANDTLRRAGIPDLPGAQAARRVAPARAPDIPSVTWNMPLRLGCGTAVDA